MQIPTICIRTKAMHWFFLLIHWTTNYHTWSCSMHVPLIFKNKVKLVDSTFSKPVVFYPLFAQWTRCNTMVLSWIQRSISDSIAKFVLLIDITSGVWKNLWIRFSHSDIFRISDIQEELHCFHQSTLDVYEYFIQFKLFWDELDNYFPFPLYFFILLFLWWCWFC